jgi:branched-chain amino acid transport system ATP-binding protein
MLEVNSINVFYGDFQALKNVSIKVYEGEIVAVIGPNGAGKTTLLKTISGILHPSSGIIKFMGERIDDLPPHEIARRGIFHVMEEKKIFPQMSVRENLELGVYVSDKWKKREKILKYIYKLFPFLKEKEKIAARALSGGEQQILAIVRGIMSQSKLLMIDVMSMRLAPKMVEYILQILRQINKKGTSILVVDHNIGKIISLASRIYILENGTITFQGGKKELLKYPYIQNALEGENV